MQESSLRWQLVPRAMWLKEEARDHLPLSVQSECSWSHTWEQDRHRPLLATAQGRHQPSHKIPEPRAQGWPLPKDKISELPLNPDGRGCPPPPLGQEGELQ